MKTDICPQCGKEFSYYPSGYKNGVKKHCSRKCQKQAAHTSTVCPQCGKEFGHHKCYPRKFCSRKCSAAANAVTNLGEHVQGHPPVETQCDNCGKLFAKSFTEHKKTKHHFCTQSCFGEWLAKTRTGIPRPEVRGARADFQSRVTLICNQCKSKYEVKKSHEGRSKFCSKACYAKWQSGSDIVSGENNFNYKGGYESYYGPDWRPQRRKARERDKYTCQRCNITESESWRELDVHHIIPFREFGIDRHHEANDLGNLISLCNVCHLITEHEQSTR